MGNGRIAFPFYWMARYVFTVTVYAWLASDVTNQEEIRPFTPRPVAQVFPYTRFAPVATQELWRPGYDIRRRWSGNFLNGSRDSLIARPSYAWVCGDSWLRCERRWRRRWRDIAPTDPTVARAGSLEMLENGDNPELRSLWLEFVSLDW